MTNAKQINLFMTSIEESAKKSANSLMEQAKAGYIRVQELRSSAVPFSEKQSIYEQSFKRLLKSKNYLYLQACRGVIRMML